MAQRPTEKIRDLYKYRCMHVILQKLKEINTHNCLTVLGYDIGLRNWIRETKGSLQTYEPKHRGKRQQGFVTKETHATLAARHDSLEK
jgi:hypothetical protein